MTSYYFNRFRPYFRRLGLDTAYDSLTGLASENFYDKIKRWESWYKGNVPSFHSYTVSLGQGRSIRCRRKSLGMAKKLSEDVADMLLNERVLITVDDGATDEFVQAALEASNFATKGNEYQERKAATGTVAYIPYLANAELDSDGGVMSADVRINYVSATGIFPTAWHNGTITEVVFAFERRHNRKLYTLMQRHYLETMDNGERQYVITNEVIDSRGAAIPFSQWSVLPSFRGMSERWETGSAEPQFIIDKLAIVNNASDDEGNPMGIPVFANSIDVLEKIDSEYDSYDVEFKLGRKKLFVSPEMVIDENGNYVFDPNDSVYYMLPEGYFNDTKEAMHEYNPELRVEQHEAAINQDLNLLSLKAGFGTQYYRFERGGIATATEVISENSDLYRTIKKHEVPLEQTLKQLIRAIIRLGVAAGHDELDPETDIKVMFDDSIIEDKATEREQDRKDVAMGVMSHAEYRAKWYGETLEVAQRNLPEQMESAGVLI